MPYIWFVAMVFFGMNDLPGWILCLNVWSLVYMLALDCIRNSEGWASFVRSTKLVDDLLRGRVSSETSLLFEVALLRSRKSRHPL